MAVLIKRAFQPAYLLVLISVLVISCKDDLPEPDIPECEELSYGSVQIQNETGYVIWVDVTWGDIDENDVRKLKDEADTVFLEVPAGDVKMWVSFDSIDWGFESESLSVCKELEYTWYLSSKKASWNELQ